MLNCHIVRDLLPSYLERLTSPETEAELTEHLSACPDCRAAKAAMEADLGVEKAPKPRRDFLRHLRWQRRLAALLTLLTAVLCLWGLYRMEYSYTLTSTAEMETVLYEEVMGREPSAAVLSDEAFPVELISMTPLKNRVFVLYRVERQGEFQYQGVAQFEKGVFGRYRLRSCQYSDWPIVQVDSIRVGRQDYLLAYCANAPEGAETFQVFAGYLPPSFAGGEALDISKETPVCEGRVRPDLLELVPITREQRDAGFFGGPAVIFRDADGNILDTRELAKTIRDSDQYGTSGLGDLPPQTYYVFSALVVLLAAALLRYFLRK